MNGKKAKALRRIAEHLGTMGKTDKETSYNFHKHKAYHAPTGKINADGSPLMVTITPVTVVLANCVRKYYQQLKRA